MDYTRKNLAYSLHGKKFENRASFDFKDMHKIKKDTLGGGGYSNKVMAARNRKNMEICVHLNANIPFRISYVQRDKRQLKQREKWQLSDAFQHGCG